MRYQHCRSLAKRVGWGAPALSQGTGTREWGSEVWKSSERLSENTVSMFTSGVGSLRAFVGPLNLVPVSLSLIFIAFTPPFQSFSSCCYANAFSSFTRISVLHIPNGPVHAWNNRNRARRKVKLHWNGSTLLTQGQRGFPPNRRASTSRSRVLADLPSKGNSFPCFECVCAATAAQPNNFLSPKQIRSLWSPQRPSEDRDNRQLKVQKNLLSSSDLEVACQSVCLLLEGVAKFYQGLPLVAVPAVAADVLRRCWTCSALFHDTLCPSFCFLFFFLETFPPLRHVATSAASFSIKNQTVTGDELPVKGFRYCVSVSEGQLWHFVIYHNKWTTVIRLCGSQRGRLGSKDVPPQPWWLLTEGNRGSVRCDRLWPIKTSDLLLSISPTTEIV